MIRINHFENGTNDLPRSLEDRVRKFVDLHLHGNFFQSVDFFLFLRGVGEFNALLWVAQNQDDEVCGVLLGVYQHNGSGIKSWLSRRLIVWGGPLILSEQGVYDQYTTQSLLRAVDEHCQRKALYVEFRNFYDTQFMQQCFLEQGYIYKPHLNYVVKTDTLEQMRGRMSKSKWRQINGSLKKGAKIVEPQEISQVKDFYRLLHDLYLRKIRKPLPGFPFFAAMWRSPHFKIFLVEYQGDIVGGIVCPIFANKVIYEWYICGSDTGVKGLYPSVLATWAPMEHGLEHGFEYFDFMGAGSPDQAYGVREFKARFGGVETCYGRYHKIVNRTFYQIGKIGLSAYKALSHAYSI